MTNKEKNTMVSSNTAHPHKKIKYTFMLIMGMKKFYFETVEIFNKADTINPIELYFSAGWDIITSQLLIMVLWNILESAYYRHHFLSDLKNWRNQFSFNKSMLQWVKRKIKLYALRKQRFVEKNKGLTHIV